MITTINEFRKNESNEQRGYITYEYDLDTNTLTRKDSGVTSEYNMWGTQYDDNGAVLPFPENKEDIKNVFKTRKLTLYKLGTSYNTDDIIESVIDWIDKNNYIGRGIGKIDENIDTDISLIENNLPSERWSGNWNTDFFTTKKNDKIYVGITVGGKRGYPRDAYIKALNTSKPALPSGFTYTTGTPINMYTNKPVTLKSIKEDDELYDDRGYTDSEFHGEVYYEVTKTTNEANITENIDITTIPKALEDIDERRPNRMKRPQQSYNAWSGRGGDQYSVYIQDEAEEVMQDKYGRERGTKNWEASIGHGARGGAMFKMADDVMKEKQFLFDELGLSPRSYWDYSYFALWKIWMDKIGQPYKIDSDADVQAKKDAKEQAEQEAQRLAKDKQSQDNKNKLTTELNNIRNKYVILNLDKYSPDAKDKQRIKDLILSRRSDESTLANKMARSITNRVKAIKRGLAAIEYFEKLTDVQSFTYITAGNVIKPFFDKALTLKESYAINEGQFSWFTQDTKTQIGSESQNTIDVYMYDNKGNKWHEQDYQGYGVFGGKDYYELVAEMNGYNSDRSVGIDIAFNDEQTKNEDGKTIFPALVQNENYDISNHDFTIQPEDDPNQSWYAEDEDTCPICGSDDYDVSANVCYDCQSDENYDDEEDMYESKIITSFSEFRKIYETNTDMLHINLLDKYTENDDADIIRNKFENYKSKIKGFKETHNELDLKIGDIIEFTSGYNDDIRYTTEILGFDSDDDIYLLWDAYWSPIRNSKIRDIKKISNITEIVETDTYESKINESIEDKDWKRMKDLIQKNIDGEGVASTLKSKSKAINRFVAGLLLSKKNDIKFDLKYNNQIDAENEHGNLPFKEFGNKAIQLGATIEEIQDVYDNTEVPQKYKELTDDSYLSKKHLDSWVTGKVSKTIIDAGYDINYLNKGGNALTWLGKDAMRQSGRTWTIGYKTEIIANGKTYKLDFDAITSESVDNNIVYYVIADSSDSIFYKYFDNYKKYGIREFTKIIIEQIKNDNNN
jgi:hypothetical protein